jgi:hypothetical protein
MLNVETLHDFIEQIIPPITQKEYEYLVKDKVLLKIYNEDKSPKDTTCEPIEGEPGFLFHEFIFLLGLIAIHCWNHSSVTATIIEDFFVEKLGFERRTTIPKFVDPNERDHNHGEDEYYDEDVESDDELEMDEQQRQFMAFLERKQHEDDNFIIDFEEILTILDADLPMIPGVP